MGDANRRRTRAIDGKREECLPLAYGCSSAMRPPPTLVISACGETQRIEKRKLSPGLSFVTARMKIASWTLFPFLEFCNLPKGRLGSRAKIFLSLYQPRRDIDRQRQHRAVEEKRQNGVHQRDAAHFP